MPPKPKTKTEDIFNACMRQMKELLTSDLANIQAHKLATDQLSSSKHTLSRPKNPKNKTITI